MTTDAFPTCPIHPGTLLLRRSADGSMRCIRCTDDAGNPKDGEPWERLARARKVHAIVTLLHRVMPAMTADKAAELDDAGRAAAARLAQVRPASEKTWTEVVKELRRAERIEHRAGVA
jgi:hypothetical protein